MFQILPPLRLIRLLLLIVFINGFLSFSLKAESIGQIIDLKKRITISFDKIILKTALDKIATTSSVAIIYSNSKELNSAVSIKAQNKPLKDVLNELLTPFPLTYRVIDGKIVISHDESKIKPSPTENKRLLLNTLKGVVTDEQGKPLAGATIKLKQSNNGVITDKDGNFAITNVPITGTLVISFVGYQIVEINYNGNPNTPLAIQLKTDANSLNAVQIIGYGTTTKRLNTGSVSTITAKEIEDQPVTNVLSALSGRAAGVFVQTTNGLPGGNINIQIRGKGSILAGTDPLYIVDGVPFASQVVPSSIVSINSVVGSPSPLNSLNPADIESITILKDADATAIYGSRGTNGVVLITTKKGKSGQTKVDVNISQGITKVASYPELLNLQQYLQIRKEAFANDGLIPSSDPTSSSYAPDLTVWSQTQNTNWAKYMLGGTGHMTNAQLGISGGSENTSFNISGNYHGESTVLPGNNLYQRGGLFFNLQHKSTNKKFSLLFTGSYTLDNNTTVDPANIATDILLPPNYPVYDATGNYNWYVVNPVADLQATNKTHTDNLIANLSLNYKIIDGLNLKLSTGFNKININLTDILPTVALYPGTTNSTDFGLNSNLSVIIEPQLDYTKSFKNSSLSVLAGGTYQSSIQQGQIILASDFSTQSLMQNIGSAGTLTSSNTYTQYKYESVFGRVTYNLDEKYILNGTMRRDGSSRFGPGNQFGNFGSIGAAWLFSNESFVKDNIPVLSFGKLRASYGLTGNDQITDYQYLSTYGSSSISNYQGIPALIPTRIANADFHWETTRKIEFAVELGFLKDRILFNINRYQDESNDQLVNYAIPRITGFANYEANLPAVVENTGWEFELNTKNIQNQTFSWTTSINLTLPKNVLKSFDNFSTSSYAQTLQLGYDITRISGYQFTGVNPATGIANYAPQPGSNSTDPYEYFTIGKQTPNFYGGIGNTFTYKRWSLDVFGQFAKQMALGGLNYTPGGIQNNYAIVLNRWQKPGDITNMPKASTNSDFYYSYSTANYYDASYFRLKNISLSYSFLPEGLKSIGISQLRLYAEGQNLYTWWNLFLTPNPEPLWVPAGKLICLR